MSQIFHASKTHGSNLAWCSSFWFNMDVDLYDDLLISDEPSEREKALASENESLKVSVFMFLVVLYYWTRESLMVIVNPVMGVFTFNIQHKLILG